MIKDVHRVILDLVVEDFYGLWELVWRLQTCGPGLTHKRATQVAQTAISTLHEQDLVELFRGTKGDPLPIATADVPSLLAEDRNWAEPKARTGRLLIAATQKGEEVYYQA